MRLFVSHGGQSSCQESLCHQKPMVSLKRVFQQELKIELWFPATTPGTGDHKCSLLLNILLFKVEFVAKYLSFNSVLVLSLEFNCLKHSNFGFNIVRYLGSPVSASQVFGVLDKILSTASG